MLIRQFVLVFAAVLALVGAVQAADPYKLGVSDKIFVRVVEWKAAELVFEEWTALSGEYRVGPTGNTSFPFVGEVESAGKSTAELADTLSEGLRQSLGLVTAPEVSVEIAEFGPIYVTGDVQTPGEYPFSPGLNVIKALSLAGGERRAAPDSTTRAAREVLNTSGALEVLQEEYKRLLARRARLDAELANGAEIGVPEELAGAEDAAGLVEAENAILLANSRQLVSQQTALEDQVALLNRELETFQQKRVTVEQQLAIAQEQLANVRNLADDGLAIASRVSSLETSVADLETRLLDIDTAILQAQQAIGDADRERARLTDMRVSDLTLERQEVDAKLADVALRLKTQQGLVNEAVAFSGMELSGEDEVETYSYTIIREGEELQADATTPVVAGDVVVARLQLSSDPL